MEKFPRRRSPDQLHNTLPEEQSSIESRLGPDSDLYRELDLDKRAAFEPDTAKSDDEFAFADFRRIDARFDALSETGEPNRYQLNEIVQFQKDRGSVEMAEWKVVRAEKNHYFLERTGAPGNYIPGYVMVSEAELTNGKSKL